MVGRRPQNAASKNLACLVSGTLLDRVLDIIQVVSPLPSNGLSRRVLLSYGPQAVTRVMPIGHL